MHRSNTFAILVGVDHYSHLARSAWLRGPVNDVDRWARYVQHVLGVPEGQLIRLESPLPGRPPNPVASGRATVANVIEAVETMQRWLEANPSGTGLFVFSGHGATDARFTAAEGDRLRMCMEDFEEELAPRETSVGLGSLSRAFGALSDQLTIITDCCYGSFSIAGSDEGLAPQERSHALGSRLLLGSGEFSPAWGLDVGGRWHGVFTATLTSTLALWRYSTVDGVRYCEGSHQDILFRTRAMMMAMGFSDQQPVYGGGDYVAALPFNYPSTTAPRSAVKLEPNSPRQKREVGANDDIPYVWQFLVPWSDGETSGTIVPVVLVQAGGAVPVSQGTLHGQQTVLETVTSGPQMALFVYNGLGNLTNTTGAGTIEQYSPGSEGLTLTTFNSNTYTTYNPNVALGAATFTQFQPSTGSYILISIPNATSTPLTLSCTTSDGTGAKASLVGQYVMLEYPTLSEPSTYVVSIVLAYGCDTAGAEPLSQSVSAELTLDQSDGTAPTQCWHGEVESFANYETVLWFSATM